MRCATSRSPGRGRLRVWFVPKRGEGWRVGERLSPLREPSGKPGPAAGGIPANALESILRRLDAAVPARRGASRRDDDLDVSGRPCTAGDRHRLQRRGRRNRHGELRVLRGAASGLGVLPSAAFRNCAHRLRRRLALTSERCTSARDMVYILSDSSGRIHPQDSRVAPTPVSAKKVSGPMTIQKEPTTCVSCGRASEAISGGVRACRCASRETPATPPRAETVLRHWTTDVEALRGPTRAGGSAGDWGLADSRRRNLLGSKLKSLSSGIGAS